MSKEGAEAPKPLEGVRVVELTQFIAGPLCGRLLQQMGADVLKIEPVGGERAQRIPPFAGDLSVVYQFANAGKKVELVDLRDQDQRRRLIELVDAADVFVENLSAGALERIGLPEEPPGPRNTSGIRCSIRGWDAALSGLPAERAVDATIQARSGMMWISGDDDGPGRVPFPLIDIMTGTLAALDVLGLVLQNPRPQYTAVVSMLAAAAFLQGPLLLAAATGSNISPLGNDNLFTCPNGPFAVKDGHVSLAVFDDRSWKSLVSSIQVDVPSNRERAWTLAIGRLADRADVNGVVAAALQRITKEEALAKLTEGGIPCAEVASIDDVIADDEIRAMMRLGVAPEFLGPLVWREIPSDE